MDTSATKNFVHLHLHNYYSFLDGFGSPEEHVARAKELGMKAIASTNHNHLGGVIEFQNACRKHGLKPILGLEGYYTWDTGILALPLEERDKLAIEKAQKAGVQIDKKMKKSELNKLIEPFRYDTEQYHILFLAINQTGWKNLVRLQSEASEKCTFNGRFLCDIEMLRKYNEGLIMTTACIGGIVPELFIQGRDEEAENILNEWHDIFGDRFFVEIQPLDIEKQWIANVKLIKWAKEHGVKIVATNDVHYVRKEDHDDHDTLLCIGIGRFKDEEDRMRYSNDFWLKSYEEMIESFQNQADSMEANDFPGKEYFDRDEYLNVCYEALDNTNIVADMIDDDIKLGSSVPLFPKIDIPYGFTPEQYLEMKCWKKLYEYKQKKPEIDLKKYERRLATELQIINSKGFAPYMLIVEEYIDWANKNGCPTGPGRGSAAGSLVLFLLGITKIIDPIEYDLLFFRFLTRDRTSPPDWLKAA